MRHDSQGILLTEEVLNGPKILHESELPEGSLDLPLKMRLVRVRFADSESQYNYCTDINGTRRDITMHFNQPLNFGGRFVEGDDMRTPVRLEFPSNTELEDDPDNDITVIVTLND